MATVSIPAVDAVVATGAVGDWSLCQWETGRLYITHAVVQWPTRFQARSKDQEIKRREVELDPQVSPEEIMSREVELGCESWTSFASSCCSTAVQLTLFL